MSEFRKHSVYKIPESSEDIKKIQKIIDRYISDIDDLVVLLLEENIFNNGISDKVKDKLDTIKKGGRNIVKL